MIEVKDIVPLRFGSGNASTIRFIISPAMIESLDLEAGDLIQIIIFGVFKDPDQTDPIPLSIPMPGKVIKAGGASLGVTIRRNIVKRLKLQENDELLVSVEKVKNSSK